jgi:hypothetical protein
VLHEDVLLVDLADAAHVRRMAHGAEALLWWGAPSWATGRIEIGERD